MSFAINIENPRSGWIDIELCVGERRFEFAASDVANDPVRELAELALSVVRGEPLRARAVFWLEPSGYELSALRDPQLELTVSYSEHAFASLFDPEVMLRHRVDATETGAEILRCLRAAKGLLAKAATVDARPWAHAFPDDRLAELEAAVQVSTKSDG